MHSRCLSLPALRSLLCEFELYLCRPREWRGLGSRSQGLCPSGSHSAPLTERLCPEPWRGWGWGRSSRDLTGNSLYLGPVRRAEVKGKVCISFLKTLPGQLPAVGGERTGFLTVRKGFFSVSEPSFVCTVVYCFQTCNSWASSAPYWCPCVFHKLPMQAIGQQGEPTSQDLLPLALPLFYPVLHKHRNSETWKALLSLPAWIVSWLLLSSGPLHLSVLQVKTPRSGSSEEHFLPFKTSSSFSAALAGSKQKIYW